MTWQCFLELRAFSRALAKGERRDDIRVVLVRRWPSSEHTRDGRAALGVAGDYMSTIKGMWLGRAGELEFAIHASDLGPEMDGWLLQTMEGDKTESVWMSQESLPPEAHEFAVPFEMAWIERE